MAISTGPAGNARANACWRTAPAALSDAELLAVILRTGIRARVPSNWGAICSSASRAFAGIFGGDLTGVKGLGPGQARAVRGSDGARAPQPAGRHAFCRRPHLPCAVRDYLRLAIASREHEVVRLPVARCQHRVIASQELFRGTLTQTSVLIRAKS
jgi:DNA repair protein RadC